MKLILFRHGLAVDREIFIEKKMADGLRPLTEKGKDKTRKTAKSLLAQIGETQALVSSPLVRAQQTAEIIGEILPYDRYFECSELVPEAPPQAFANWLKSHVPNATSVVAVGHEPQMSVFASWLLSGLTTSFLDLKKSGMIALEVESFEHLGPRSAELRWLLNPKQV
jgi:phosphohistidine phosphatase